MGLAVWARRVRALHGEQRAVLTARTHRAHRTLTLGSKVLIHLLETDAQMEVKITDRGPYVDPWHRMDIH